MKVCLRRDDFSMKVCLPRDDPFLKRQFVAGVFAFVVMTF
jgi:hypothetical protein